jgi:hypothetical protein
MPIFIMLVFFVITSHNPNLIQSQVRAKPPDEVYKVYSALIRQRYVNDSTKLILVSAETANPDRSSPPDREDLRRMLMPLTQSTIDSYKAKGQDIRELLNEFDLPVKYILIKKAEWDEMFKVDNFSGWESLFRKYPDASGIIRFSEIGFNAEHTQALVYVERGCGSTCAEGGYVLLSKEGEAWTIQKEVIFMAA